MFLRITHEGGGAPNHNLLWREIVSLVHNNAIQGWTAVDVNEVRNPFGIFLYSNDTNHYIKIINDDRFILDVNHYKSEKPEITNEEELITNFINSLTQRLPGRAIEQINHL